MFQNLNLATNGKLYSTSHKVVRIKHARHTL